MPNMLKQRPPKFTSVNRLLTTSGLPTFVNNLQQDVLLCVPPCADKPSAPDHYR